MTKLQQLIENVLNQSIEVSDKSNSWQCMDWAYCWVFCLGYPKATIQQAKAYQVYTSPRDITKQYFDLIPNTPDFVPIAGDLAVWGTSVGPAGHIAVCDNGSTKTKLITWDQNWNGVQKVIKVSHTYDGVIGFLRPKTNPEDCETKLAWYETEYPKEQQRVIDARTERDAIKTDYDHLTTEYNRLKEDSRIQIGLAEDIGKAQKEKYQAFIGQVASLLLTTQDEATILPAIDRLVTVEDQLSGVRKELDQTTKTLGIKDTKISEMATEIKRLQEEARKAKGLGDATTADLINEIISRLVKIIKK